MDERGTPDTVEMFNVAKDDALSYPAVTHRTYPSTVNARMESTLTPFVRKAVEVNTKIISVFEQKLGMAEGTLVNRHTLLDPSGSEARIIRNPPQKAALVDDPRIAIAPHTDFGSLSFLLNRLGGLQVLPPGYDTWHYVRPLPGHAICNIGDALTLFSGGILRSNLHRVVPAPGAQAAHVRWSVVFFTRPGHDVQLRALVEDSELVNGVIAQMSEEEKARFEPNATSKEWHMRRVKYQRLKNREGPETWKASRGMEHKKF